MIGLVRAAVLIAALALGLASAQAADKAFKRDDLADAAIKLEAQIKKLKDLVDKRQENRREIIADGQLRRVFGKDKVTMFEMNKHLTAHLR